MNPENLYTHIHKPISRHKAASCLRQHGMNIWRDLLIDYLDAATTAVILRNDIEPIPDIASAQRSLCYFALYEAGAGEACRRIERGVKVVDRHSCERFNVKKLPDAFISNCSPQTRKILTLRKLGLSYTQISFCIRRCVVYVGTVLHQAKVRWKYFQKPGNTYDEEFAQHIYFDTHPIHLEIYKLKTQQYMDPKIIAEKFAVTSNYVANCLFHLRALCRKDVLEPRYARELTKIQGDTSRELDYESVPSHWFAHQPQLSGKRFSQTTMVTPTVEPTSI